MQKVADIDLPFLQEATVQLWLQVEDPEEVNFHKILFIQNV
jgi:hypothetical protein